MAQPVLPATYMQTDEDFYYREEAMSQLEDLHIIAEKPIWDRLPTAHKLLSCLYTNSFNFVRDYKAKQPTDISTLETTNITQQELYLTNAWMSESTRDELDEIIRQRRTNTSQGHNTTYIVSTMSGSLPGNH